MQGYLDWPGAKQVVRVIRSRTGGGATSAETALFVTSLGRDRAGAEALARIIRGHWGIENGLHRVRDVTFGEDACRVRSGDAPQVLAAVRNALIGTLNLAGVKNKAAAQRRYVIHPLDGLALLKLKLGN